MKPIRILREKFGSMNFALLIWIIKGMAAILSVDSNLADFATISATGKKALLVSVPGTGTKPKKP
jgi:hypothetical protein